MEVIIKECEVCIEKVVCLCDKFMTFFCESFFNFENKKN